MSRILLADDHPMIRTALEALLRDTVYTICGTAASGDEALRQAQSERPDILLLDLQMPGGTGMDVIRKLHLDADRPRIVILTAAIDDASLMEARRLGVSGCVLKNSDPAYLLTCLDAVQAGGIWLDPELAARMQELTESGRNKRKPALAPRERQLIHFVRQGLRNREIAQELGISEGTVKVYLHGIFEKLNVKSRTELAVRSDEFLGSSRSE